MRPCRRGSTPARIGRSDARSGSGSAIKRWEHEGALDAAQRRLDAAPDTTRIRRQIAEHPFGTLKARMGPAHLLARPLKRVGTEMSFSVPAHNLKRPIAALGVRPLIQAIRA